MKKRIISLLLVVSMVLSLLPVSALAAGTKDTAADRARLFGAGMCRGVPGGEGRHRPFHGSGCL